MHSRIRQLHCDKTVGENGISARALLCAVLIVISLSLSFCNAVPLPPVNMTSDGVAIKGYDPVAYFTEGDSHEGRTPAMNINGTGQNGYFQPGAYGSL